MIPVFGPQKGATPGEVEELAAGLDIYASVLKDILGHDISSAPGSGASGGLGAGLMLLGANLRPRFDVIMKYFRLDEMMAGCDLVITAEGGIDYQTPRGKIPAEVASRAKKQLLPVIVLAGTIGRDANVNYAAGIDAFASIMQCPSTLERAIKDAERLLIEGTESAMRMVTIGSAMGQVMEKQKSSRNRAIVAQVGDKGPRGLFLTGKDYIQFRIFGRWRL
jgi:glycerate kinase